MFSLRLGKCVKWVVSPKRGMVPSVSPLNKKEPNGIQETNIRAIKPVVVVIQMDFTSGRLTHFMVTKKKKSSILNKPAES